MTTETITWTPVEQGLPDADTTVMMSLDETHSSEPTWPGYYGGEGWMDISGMPIFGVLAWAHMPKGIRP